MTNIQISSEKKNLNSNENIVESEDILKILEDPACRKILDKLGKKSMSASQLANFSDMSLSTVYRKLDLLTNFSLVEKRNQIHINGRHKTKYACSFESIDLNITAQDGLEISLVSLER